MARTGTPPDKDLRCVRDLNELESYIRYETAPRTYIFRKGDSWITGTTCDIEHAHSLSELGSLHKEFGSIISSIAPLSKMMRSGPI